MEDRLEYPETSLGCTDAIVAAVSPELQRLTDSRDYQLPPRILVFRFRPSFSKS